MTTTTTANAAKKKKLSKEERKALKWAHSEARSVLYEDLVGGIIPIKTKYRNGDLRPKQLFDSHYKHLFPFQISDFNNAKLFTSRLYGLRKQLKEKYARTEIDEKALENDRKIFPVPLLDPRGYPEWRKSQAYAALKLDMDLKKHKEMKPAALWVSRPEYQDFPLEVFRNHIYKEAHKRKLKKKKKHKVKKHPKAPQGSKS